MIGTTRVVRVFAYRKAVDLRKGYDGLFGLVREGLRRDPLEGDCYLFTNSQRTSAKVLFWDGTGLCIFMKRLVRGRFACLWRGDSEEALQLTMGELGLFIEGSTLVGRQPLSPREYRLKSIAESVIS